jgi:hypothetical protein
VAAGLTHHRWSVAELFFFKVPPPRKLPPFHRGWKPPKRRVRPSKATLELVNQWCGAPRLSTVLPQNQPAQISRFLV